MPGAEENASVSVLDASVAVRWVVPERGSDEVAGIFAEPVGWIAPRLMLSEAASALRRKVVANGLRVEIAAQALDVLLQAVTDGVLRLADDEELVATALMLAIDLGHKVPDCLYLALALREGAGLVTADRRLSELARSQGVAARLMASA